MKQHCDDEVLSAFADGELEPDEAGRVAEHVAACPSCREALAAVKAIRDTAGELAELEPPPRVWQAIRERVDPARAGSGRRPARRWLWAGVPAAAVAAALLVVFVARQPSAPATRRAASTVATATVPVPAPQAPAAAAPEAAVERHAPRPAAAPARAAHRAGEPAHDDVAGAVASDYQQFLRGVDQAIVECRAAERENPGNVRVRLALLDAQSSRMTGMDRLVSGGD